MTERRRIVYSISLSAGLWGLLTVLVLLVPLRISRPPERAYNDVVIRFDVSRSEPPAAAPSAVLSPPPQTSEPRQTVPRQPAPPPSSQSQALSPQPAQPPPAASAPQQQALSPSPQLAPDFSGGTFSPANARTETARTVAVQPRPEWPDDGEFTEFSSEIRAPVGGASSGNTAAAPHESVFSGTAGTTAPRQDTGAAVTGSGQRSDTSEAVSSVSASLDTITRTYTNRDSSGGVSYETFLNAGSSATGDSAAGHGAETSLAAVGADGQKRRLRQPKDPVITLSAESEQLIGSSIKVSITISVLPAGNIQRSGITFTPESALPPQIRAEIADQITQWRFDPGKNDGQATFEYSIKKE